jgi:glycosyltransferase involved in cell wall biosynthesis
MALNASGLYISIITVNYNDVTGLQRTVKSVQEQNLTNYEHIIIDGASTDGSKELIERQQSRFSYWVSEPDQGIYHAMNKGITKMVGDYVLFLNSGDHFKNKSSLSALVSSIDPISPQQFIYGNIEVVGKNTWVKKYPSRLSPEYFVKDTLPHPATLIHNTCFINKLYSTDYKIVSDWKFFMEGIINQNYTYSYVDELISVFYFDGLSSLQPEAVAEERRNIISKYFPNQLILHDHYFTKTGKTFFQKYDHIILSLMRFLKKRLHV